MIKKVAKLFFPLSTRRGRLLKKILAKVGLAKSFPYNYEYDRWVRSVESETFLPVIKATSSKMPLFSIVIPFYNTPDKYLYPLLDSITGQSYQNWELIVADASTDSAISKKIKESVEYDERLKYFKITENLGISGNTNQALKKASGDYIIFCDHDDTLSPHALNEVAHKIQDDPTIDIVYSDEDKLTDNGKWRHSPFFKPAWSPHLFLYTNYTNHLSIIRKKLVDEVGGLDSEFDGSQDYDLLLRIHANSKKPLNVRHINKILYHWREAAGSTAISHSSKNYAFVAGEKALQRYIDSLALDGQVESINNRPGYYYLKMIPKTNLKATVYVGVSKDEKTNQLIANKISRLTKTTKVTADFIAVDPLKMESIPNIDESGSVVFKIKETVYPREADWLERLCGALELPGVNSIAPRILAPDDGRVIDMGICNDSSGNQISMFAGLASNELTPVGSAEWVYDVDRLSGAIVGYSPLISSDRKYNVVWSHVIFRSMPIFTDSESLFNHNVHVTPKGKIKVNG